MKLVKRRSWRKRGSWIKRAGVALGQAQQHAHQLGQREPNRDERRGKPPRPLP